ncbi:MAG: mannose-1-phosphate guanylyltransferase [Lachnospiraceae bacterium]|nr:mannose-1-phosphate guanylyltransferase [Lachnospiraceae bacterium]
MDIRYIELKTGYCDNGPAWIGNVKESKSGKTIYFNDHAFQKYHGISGNYIDVESGEEYWISCVKKNGEDRHWAGNGKITIDRKVVDAYLAIVQADKLDDARYIAADIEDVFPVERISALLNQSNR